MLILQLENTQELLSPLINIISFSIKIKLLLAQARNYLINIAHEEFFQQRFGLKLQKLYSVNIQFFRYRSFLVGLELDKR